MVQNSSGFRPLLIVGGLVCGLCLLLYLTRVSWVQRGIDKMIQRTLEQTGLVRVMDYELLLRIQHGYVISQVEIMGDSPIANQSLRRSRPWDHGVIVLSIKSGGKDLPGIPSADTTLSIGDVVTLYGEEHHIRALFETTKPALD
jgi:Trk K+ transport system NAD-binding subunit